MIFFAYLHRSGDQLAWVSGTSEATIFIGAVAGQLSMGFLGDILTRNQALTVTLAISSFAAFLSAIAPAGNPTSIYSIIILFRFIVGFGLGGIYPLSATKASEDSASTSGKTNSSGSAYAFFWQIPGAVSPWLLSYILSYTTLSTGYRWRLVLGLGSIPPLLSIICLWLESYLKPVKLMEDNKNDINTTTTTAPKITLSLIIEKLKDPIIRNKLIGCGGTWLLYDIVYYGLSLLGGVVISAISDTDDDVSSDSNIRNLCSKQSIAVSCGAISVLISIYILPYLSLKYLQILGFIVQGLLLLLFVSLFSYLKEHNSTGLFILYCLALMSLQLGVPVTTYALPASVFDKDIRCTFNGIASAMGKIGAIIGAYSFYYIAKESIHAVLIICVVVSLIGAVVTYYYLPDAYLCNKDTRRQERCTTSMTLLEATLSSHDEEMLLQSPLSWNTWDSNSAHTGNSEHNDSSSIVYNNVHNKSSSGSINTSNEYNNSFVVEL